MYMDAQTVIAVVALITLVLLIIELKDKQKK